MMDGSTVQKWIQEVIIVFLFLYTNCNLGEFMKSNLFQQFSEIFISTVFVSLSTVNYIGRNLLVGNQIECLDKQQIWSQWKRRKVGICTSTIGIVTYTSFVCCIEIQEDNNILLHAAAPKLPVMDDGIKYIGNYR